MAKCHLLITAVGPDRIGFVDDVTAVLVNHSANIEESRMDRKVGEFLALILLSVGEEAVHRLSDDLAGLRQNGMEVTARRLPPRQTAFEGYQFFRVSVRGADHEGIIRRVAHALNRLGINIAELESEVEPAPTTGTPLFNMKAMLQVPPALSLPALDQEMQRVAGELAVAIEITAA